VLSIGANCNEHSTVIHSKGKYVRSEVNTNTIENYFSVFKRGMRGIHQRYDEKHLPRHFAEFDCHNNNREALGVDDAMRFERLPASLETFDLSAD